MIHLSGVRCSKFRALCTVLYLIFHQALRHSALAKDELPMLLKVVKNIVLGRKGSLFMYLRNSQHCLNIDIRPYDETYANEYDRYYCKSFLIIGYITNDVPDEYK